MKLFSLIALMAISIYSTSVSAQSLSECTAQSCVRVGSFNIELLGSQRKRRGSRIPKRADGDLQALAKLIGVTSKFDVVALQEIDTSSRQWTDLKAHLDAQGYSVAIEGTTSGRNQYLVLLYRRETIDLIAGSAAEIDVPTRYDFGGGCRYEGLRQPIAAKFSAEKFDFIVTAVHLKSKSARGIPSDCPDKIRKAQTSELVNSATALREKHDEADIILVGDFNASAEENSLKPLATAGFVSQMKFRAEGSGKYSFRKGRENLIDHVMFIPSATSEYVPKSGFVYLVEDTALKEHVRNLSDHMPVWSSFFAGKDDD